MGYDSYVSGELVFQPSLKPIQVAELQSFADTSHTSGDLPGCGHPDWGSLEPDGSAMVFDDTFRLIDLKGWVCYLVEGFLKPWGVLANGALFIDGEDSEDFWRIEVTDSVVVHREGLVIYEGDPIEAHGVKATITHSAGSDGAVVVFLETGFEPNASDGGPGLRVLVNDDPVYEGVPYRSAETEQDSSVRSR
jgi:hypothetical protein